MRFKKILIFVVLSLLSISGVLFGCQNKYENMRLTSNRDETGLQLYLGEDSDLEDGSKPSIGTVTFTVSGVGGNVSKKLKYNYDASIVRILSEEFANDVTTLTLQAISGGSTKFIAITEEGGKTNSVDVDCIRRITDLKFDSTYKPAIFNKPGSSLVINSKQIIFNNGSVEGTTQNEVVYSLKNAVDGVELASGGTLTLTKAVSVQDITVVATSKSNSQYSDEVNVHLVKVFDEDSIDIVSLSPVYKDGEIILTTDGDESNVTLVVDVETDEEITLYYKLKENENITTSSTNCVTVEQNINEFHMYADSIGNCLFEVEVHLSNYTDAPVVKKTIPVNVVKLPKIININGITTDFSDDIFTYYQNGLGKQYAITIGDKLAYNKQFVVATDSNLDFNIKKRDGSLIKCATLQDGSLTGEYEILNAETEYSIFVSGNLPNQSANLYIYAYGSLGYSGQLVRKLSLTTLLGSTAVEPQFSTLDGEETSTYYVEVGKSFVLDYHIDENSSAKGIRLVNTDGSELDGFVAVDITNGVKPVITVSGISQGQTTCKLVLSNFVSSISFDICVFVPVQYDDEEALSGGYKLSVDSPLQNRNIAEANYIYGSLTNFVLSIGTGTQLNLSTEPNNATVYSLKYSSVILVDGEEEIDGSTYATISRTGYIAAKKVLPQTISDESDEEISHIQKLYIQVQLTSLITNEDGSISTIVGTKYVEMEVYVPLTNVVLSKTSSTIYWEEGLNVIQRENMVYMDTISMAFYPNVINTSKVRVSYDINLPTIVDNTNHTIIVSAHNMPENVADEKVYTLTATIQYYSTIIVRRVTFNVVKPIKAERINAYIDDIEKYVAYFDVSSFNEGDAYNVPKIKINTSVYSAELKQNVTFPKVYYSIDEHDRYIASVDEDGYITPISAGVCEVKVYAEDMIAADGTPTMYKTIYVIVADGRSSKSALRIRNESDFEKINPNYCYYFSSDVRLTKEYHFGKLSGKIDGNGYNLQNVKLNQFGSLFEEIAENAEIKDLNIYLSFNKMLNETFDIAGLVHTNNGRVEAVNAYYSTASVQFAQGLQNEDLQNLSLHIAGLVAENNGVLSKCAASMDLQISNNNQICEINELLIGGLTINNKNLITGSNNNYRYYSSNFVQSYEFSGNISIQDGILAKTSAIGGIAAINDFIANEIRNIAVEITVNAKNIDYVGGIAGKNYAKIDNVLVNAEINAKNNVGGICGVLAKHEEAESPVITNAIVELYEEVSSRGHFNNISGENFVGGLVGNAYFGQIYNSYIRSYADGCYIKGQTVGGLVGLADKIEIVSCYADVKITGLNNENDFVGGLFGEATEVSINKAYYIGTLQGTRKGLVFGKVNHAENDGLSVVSEFYTNAGDSTQFVGIGDIADYSITQSYGTDSNLQAIDTYYEQGNVEKSWKFYLDNTTEQFNWYLDTAKNQGYPILVFDDQYLMQKDMPTEIYISKANQDIKDVDGLILLDSNETYYLSDVINISTNVNSRVNIYVYCNIDGVLSTNSINHRLNTNTKLYSSEEQVITLTFVLGNNADITRKVQICFLKEVLDFYADDIKIKKGENISISSYLAYELDKSENYVHEEVNQNYVLGIPSVNIDDIEEISISNSFNVVYNQGEENEYVQTYFTNKSVLMSADSFSPESKLKLTLYYVLKYNDLDDQEITKYIKMFEYENLNLDIYTGATNIQISNSNIDMTVIDDVVFTVTLNTDNSSDKLIIENDADYIYAQINSSNVQVLNGSYDDAKVILTILEGPDYDYENEELVITFELKFKDEFLSSNLSTSFNRILSSVLTFKSKSNEQISKHININARPQNLLKIDLSNYSAGSIDGDMYIKSSQLSNTLTPGQVGMMVIDVYPEYAQYDRIEVISGTDNKGNKISFIQVVEYDLGNIKKYYELKPSSIATEDGILLQRASYVENLDARSYKFDGKFYVKTLMGSNVDYEQIVTVTVRGITNIVNENDEVLEVYEIINSIDIIVDQAPSLKLEFVGDENGNVEKGFVYNEQTQKAEEYYLAVPGQKLNFNLTYEKLSLQNLFTQAKVVKYDKQDIILNTNTYLNINPIENNSFLVEINDNAIGMLITIKADGDEIINDYKENYASNEIKILVVDCIVDSIKVNNGNDVFEIGQYTLVSAQLSAISNDNDVVGNIENKINTDSSYWWGIKNKVWNTWNLDSNGLPYKNSEDKWIYMRWNEFDAYRAGILKNDIDPTPSLGILATKQDSSEKVFRVSFEYYYNSNGRIQISSISNNSIQSKTCQKTVNMVLKTVTDIENPVPIYTIKEFYDVKNNPELDYILMNDLYFGLTDKSDLEGKEADTATMDAYTPFGLNAKSFDGNVHTIHIYGNINYESEGSTESSLNIGLFTYIEQDTILVNLDVEYNRPGKILDDEMITDNIAYNNYALRYNNLKNYNSIYFGGLTAQNKGVVSNCQVKINGDIEISSNDNNTKVYIAGFASQNSGKITYSSVKGPDWNNNFDKDFNYSTAKPEINRKLISNSTGEMALFVNDNNNLISNCEAEFVGLENSASPSLNAKVAGFVDVNSSAGKIINSSIAGQRISRKFNKLIELLYPIEKEDTRLSVLCGDKLQNDIYFARISSLNNVAGFVYVNAGSIENAYSAIPLETQSRSAGFVYDNSSAGTIKTVYTTSIYDGSSEQSSAHTPFTGTNELGEVLNDEQTSTIQNSYYLTKQKDTYEEDVLFKEPASRIGINLDGSSPNISYFVGFDFETIWSNEGNYVSPVIASIEKNRTDRKHFKRTEVEVDFTVDGTIEKVKQFPRSQDGKVPYTIANALQFVNTFNEYATGKPDEINNVVKRDIRLINDIDLIDYIGTTEFDNIKNVIYIGDFDGNGMSINNIKITGSGNDSKNESNYANVSSSYGLFYQIGSASVLNDDNKLEKIDFQNCNTTIRNLTLNVSEVTSSTSSFTGIIAGVIVNTAIKSLTINSSDVDVLGYNAVGGIAGAIIGNSKLHNININASVQSTYRRFANNIYTNKEFNDVDRYNNIDYDKYNRKLYDDEAYYDGEKFDLAQYAGEKVLYSYAGGIAGIVDINDTSRASNLTDQDFAYEKNTKQKVSENWTANVNVVKVFGDVSITGEIVGGLFGKINKNVYIANAKFEVSTTNSQVIGGAYVAGGLIGVNDAGAIYISSVEVAQTSVEQYDTDLTNRTGNNLFIRKNMYPFAIGGLVGIQKGGYIISSFSKTNVVNTNAKYTGGVIGYLTRYDDLANDKGIEVKEFGGYVLLEEVYTTGNVLAADDYDSHGVCEVENSINNSVTITKHAPKGYAGGIAGYYDASQYDQFNGIIGINAFHMPENYTINDYGYEAIKIEDGKLSFNTTKQKYNTQKISYSDVATGYYAAKDLSTGEQELAYFDARIGTVFGEIDSSKLNNEYSYHVNEANSAVKYNLHAKYVYNSSSITAADCKNNNGKELDWSANYNKNSIEFNDNLNSEKNLNRYSILKNGINYYIYINSNRANSSGEYLTYNSIDYSPSNTYLVLKGIDYNGINYSTLYQDENGQYLGWSENWTYKSSIYPKLKPSNLSVYKPIETEEDLLNIRSGGQYILVKDIYLTKNWNPKNLSNLKLTSAKREDGLGIINEYNSSQSIYYAIYNININSTNSSNDDAGFFASLNNSKITNINFVFGTTFDDPYNSEKHWIGNDLGFNVIAKNAGLLTGNLAQYSLINNCSVYLNSDENTIYNMNTKHIEKLEDRKYNIGGLIGNCDNGMGSSTILLNSIYGGNIVVDRGFKTYSYNINTTEINSTINNEDKINQLNFGGLVGYSVVTNLGLNLNKVVNLQLSVKRNTQNVAEISSLNIGGLLGSATSNVLDGNKVDNIKIKINDIDIKAPNLYVGGIIGLNNRVDIINSEFDGDIEINATSTYNASIGGLIGFATGLNVDNCSVNRIKETGFEYFGNITVKGTYEFLNVGGLIGEVNHGRITVSNSKSIFNSISIDGNDLNIENNLYIGGFVGAVSYENDNLFKNCLSMGNIDYNANNTFEQDCHIAGFISCGSNGSSNQTGNTSIINCISNVNIKVSDLNNIANGNHYISGFAGKDIKYISNCIALGEIYSKEIIKNKNCYFAGFTTSKDLTLSNNYSFTTMKIIDKITDNIISTSFNAGEGINYNYNMSGLDDNNQFGVQKTYAELIGKRNNAQLLLKNTLYNSSGNFLLEYSYLATLGKVDFRKGEDDAVVKAFFSNPDYVGYGSKIYPYAINSQADADTYLANANNKSNVYFLLTNSIELDDSINEISANLISNDVNAASTIYLSHAISVAEGAMICGIELCPLELNAEMDSVINENNGYLFNTISTGRIQASGSTIKMSGFVMTNNGLINSCISMTYIDADNRDNASTAGFVYTNSTDGVLYRSEATNVFYNLSSNSQVTHSGFTNNVSDLNNIYACFASPSMFDIDIQYDEDVLFNNIYGFNKQLEDQCIFINQGLINTSNLLNNPCNCKLDISSIGKVVTNTLNSSNINIKNMLEIVYGDDALEATESLFGKSCANSSFMYENNSRTPTANMLNYGFATVTSFKKTSAFDSEISYDSDKYYSNLVGDKSIIDFATYNTGDNTIENPYKINNIERYNWLMDKANSYSVDNGFTRTIYMQLVNNINCQYLANDIYARSCAWEGTDGSKYSVTNKNVYSFYNLILNSDTPMTNGENKYYVSLITSNEVLLNNFGVVGHFKTNSLSQAYYTSTSSGIVYTDLSGASLVVGRAKDLQASNSYAIYNRDNDRIRNTSSFGLLVATATGKGTITNCFASGNLIIDEDYNTSFSYYNQSIIAGMLAGSLGKYTVESCFTTGVLDVRIDRKKDNNPYIGGLFGSISRTFSVAYYIYEGWYGKEEVYFVSNVRNNYSLVSIKSAQSFVKLDAIGHVNVDPAVDSYGSYAKSDISDDGTCDGLIVSNWTTGNYQYLYSRVGRNYYNEGISLCNSNSYTAYSEQLSIKEMTSTLSEKLKTIKDIYYKNNNSNYTLLDTISTKMFDDNEYHLPIQKSFVSNNIIYKWLQINDYEITGSRMSPIEVNSSLSVANDSSKYYYLTSNLTNVSASTKISAKMFVADMYKENNNVVWYSITAISTRTPLFNNFENSSIVSMLTLTNRPLVHLFSGFAYKITINGTFTNIDDGYVFAKEAVDYAIFNTCTSQVQLNIILDSDFNYEYEDDELRNVSSFVGYTGDQGEKRYIFHNITVIGKIYFNGEASIRVDMPISGVAFACAPYTMSGENYISLEIKQSSHYLVFDRNVYIGGLSAESGTDQGYYSTGSSSNISFYSSTVINIGNFYIDINYPSFDAEENGSGGYVNTEKALHVGGLIGSVNRKLGNASYSFSGCDINFWDSSYYSKFTISNSYSGANNNGTRNRSYIGGLIGSADYCQLKSFSIKEGKKLTIESDSVNNVCYIGGIVGYGKSNAKLSYVHSYLDLYVGIKASASTCYVGGILGVSDRTDLSDIDMFGAVVAVSSATEMAWGTSRDNYYTENDIGSLNYNYIYYPLPKKINFDTRSDNKKIPLAVGGICGYFNSDGTSVPWQISVSNVNKDNGIIGLMTNTNAICRVGGFAGLAYLNDYYKDYKVNGDYYYSDAEDWRTANNWNFSSIVDNGRTSYDSVYFPDFDCSVATHYYRYWNYGGISAGPTIKDTDIDYHDILKWDDVGVYLSSQFNYSAIEEKIASDYHVGSDGRTYTCFARYDGKTSDVNIENDYEKNSTYYGRIVFAGYLNDTTSISNCSYFGEDRFIINTRSIGRGQAGYFVGGMVRNDLCDFYNGKYISA